MATVYRAHDQRLQRDVAIKLMHPHLAESADFVEKFRREALAAARITTPHSIAVYDQGQWESPFGSQLYLVMEYIDGPDVRTELQRLGSFTLGTSIEIIKQILQALSSFHAAGLVHRDVKPENVLLTHPIDQSTLGKPRLEVKVTDFGLARAISSQALSSTVMGTVAYISPEAITQQENLEAPCDLYALGIMFYEFLTGHVPFRGGTAIATAYQHVNSAMPRVSTEADWLPASLDSYIGLLTAKDPHQRPSDASQALEKLIDLEKTLSPEDLIRRIPVIPSAARSPRQTPSTSGSPERNTLTTIALPGDTPQELPTIKTPRLTHLATETTQTLPKSGTQLTAMPALAYSNSETKQTLSLVPQAGAVITGENPEEGSREKKRRSWPLLLVIVLLAALGTSSWYFLAGPGSRVDVPNVVGMTQEQATKALEEAQLRVYADHDYSDDVPAGTVISTKPGAGSRAAKKATITVVISQGIKQVTVPDVQGKDAEEAKSILSTGELNYETGEEFSETVAKGKVISQDITAGSTVNHHSVVTIIISKGRQPIDVPQLAGKSKAEALAALQALGLQAKLSESYSDTVAADLVISQKPEGGQLYKNDSVELTISLGPELIEVPHVVGKSQADAIKALEDAGFKVIVKKPLGISTLNSVFSQSASGKQPKGSTITISVV